MSTYPLTASKITAVRFRYTYDVNKHYPTGYYKDMSYSTYARSDTASASYTGYTSTRTYNYSMPWLSSTIQTTMLTTSGYIIEQTHAINHWHWPDLIAAYSGSTWPFRASTVYEELYDYNYYTSYSNTITSRMESLFGWYKQFVNGRYATTTQLYYEVTATYSNKTFSVQQEWRPWTVYSRPSPIVSTFVSVTNNGITNIIRTSFRANDYYTSYYGYQSTTKTSKVTDYYSHAYNETSWISASLYENMEKLSTTGTATSTQVSYG